MGDQSKSNVCEQTAESYPVAVKHAWINTFLRECRLMKGQIKKILAILFVVLFVVTITASAVSAEAPIPDMNGHHVSGPPAPHSFRYDAYSFYQYSDSFHPNKVRQVVG